MNTVLFLSSSFYSCPIYFITYHMYIHIITLKLWNFVFMILFQNSI